MFCGGCIFRTFYGYAVPAGGVFATLFWISYRLDPMVAGFDGGGNFLLVVEVCAGLNGGYPPCLCRSFRFQGVEVSWSGHWWSAVTSGNSHVQRLNPRRLGYVQQKFGADNTSKHAPTPSPSNIW